MESYKEENNVNRIIETYNSFALFISRSLSDIALLALRLIAAKIFLQSGITKWSGLFQFNEEKYDLFLYEFFCPDPVRDGALLLCDAETLEYVEGSATVTVIEYLAIFAGIAEVLFPILLIIGLFTRLGALGLIGMTLFIQLAVFPTWDHWWNPASWWFVSLLAVFAIGPGRLSLDNLLKLDGRRL